MSKSFSGVTAPNLIKFVHIVATFNMLLNQRSYIPILFGMPERQ